MSINAIIVAAIVIIGILAIGRLVVDGRHPTQQSFRCGRCSTISMHTGRTIEAWRRGKTKFFCNSCHSEWLKTQPRDVELARSVKSRRSGCFGVVVLFTSIPVAALWAYFSK